VLIVTYDENDGFFDHLVPPTPPRSAAEGRSTLDTSDEIFAGNSTYASGPYGLGIRVPTIIVSPWTKGGWVCSEVFDHTSLIRFIERRFASSHPGLIETNITAWRRAICGDLTSAFDFATPHVAPVALPSTSGYAPPDRDRHPDYVPLPPAQQALPAQEHGLRHARALPYELHVNGFPDVANGSLRLDFANTGQAGACFHVRSGNTSSGPWTYTVEAGQSLSDSWTLAQTNQGRYDLSVYGPNGFLRAFRGSIAQQTFTNLDIDSRYDVDDYELVVVITNRGSTPCGVNTANAYDGDTDSRLLRPAQSFHKRWSLNSSFGWYDVTIAIDIDRNFLRRLAGHLENGKDSASDPAFSGRRERSKEHHHSD
jgi:phospholipase C